LSNGQKTLPTEDWLKTKRPRHRPAGSSKSSCIIT